MLAYGKRNMWVKRNLFTAVVIVDPGTEVGLFTLAMMEAYIRNGVPARIACVLVPGGSVKWPPRCSQHRTNNSGDSTSTVPGRWRAPAHRVGPEHRSRPLCPSVVVRATAASNPPGGKVLVASL